MPLLHIAILAAVQGITEFLPISSSGHLVVAEEMLGLTDPDRNLVLNVAVHVGSLGAVMLYLWRDLWDMAKGLFAMMRGKFHPGSKLFGNLIVATIPVVIAGYFVNLHLGDVIQSVEIVAWATLGFGLLLYATDKFFMTVRRIEHMGAPSALLMGLFQVLSLIPGTSRSGITMTAARLLGYERSEAARFSMLMSIPTIIGAGTLKSWELYQAGDVALGQDALVGAVLAFICALIAIVAMMSWLRRATFTPFVIYRVLLGLLLLGWVYGYFGDLSATLSTPS